MVVVGGGGRREEEEEEGTRGGVDGCILGKITGSR